MDCASLVARFLAFWFAGFAGGFLVCLPFWLASASCRVASDASLDIRGL